MRFGRFKLMKGEVSRGTAYISIGNFFNAGLSMLFVLFCSKLLSGFNFGLFSVCLTTWFLLQEIFDLGITNLTIRFSGKYLNEDFRTSYRYFKTAFVIRLIISLLILLIFFIFGRYFSSDFLNQPRLFTPLLIIVLGEFGAMIFLSLTSIIISLKRFKLYAFLYVFQGFSRLLLLSIIFFLNISSLENLVLIIIIPPFITSLIAFIFIPKDVWLVNLKKEIFFIFFNNIKWLFIWGLFMTLSNRIYVYLLTAFDHTEEAGIFSLAYLFASVPLLLVNSFSSALLPKISQLKKINEVSSFYKKSLRAVFLLSVLILVLFTLVAVLFSESKYYLITKTFQGLIIGMIFVILSVPATTTLWVFNKPKLFSLIAISQFAIASVLGFMLVKSCGIDGAVISFVSVSFIVCVLTNSIILKIFNKNYISNKRNLI